VWPTLPDVLKAVRDFELTKYLCSLWNPIDWLHLILMLVAWILWLFQMNMQSSLTMPATFDILTSKSDQTVARLFSTNANEEFAFLKFIADLNAMRRNLGMYSVLTSISGERLPAEHCPLSRLLDTNWEQCR
jgi:hypothetical protein